MSAPAEELFWRRRAWWLETGRAGIAILIASTCGFAATVVAARAIGPNGYGALVVALATVASIATFLDFSLEEAVLHFAAKALAAKDRAALRGLLFTSVRLDLIVGLAVFAVFALGAGSIAEVVAKGGISAALIRLAAIEVLLTTANGTTGAILMLSGRAESRAWMLAWTNGLRLVLVFATVHLFAGGPMRVLGAYVAGSGLGALTQAVLARRVVRREWGGAPRGAPPVGVRRLATFGLHSSTTTTVIALRTAFVSVVLGRAVGAPAVGIFTVALIPVTLAQIASAPLRITTFSEQASLSAQGRTDVLRRAVVAYTGLAALVGMAAAAIGWFLLPWLLPFLFQVGFRDAVDPARILLIAAVATLATAWSKSLPAAVGRPQIRTAVSTGELLLTVAVLLPLASRGARGAAWAISIVAVVSACTWLVVARRMLADVTPPVARSEDRP